MKLKYTHFLLAFFIITLCSTTAMATQNNHTVMRFVVCSDLHDWKGSGEKDIINFINWLNNENN